MGVMLFCTNVIGLKLICTPAAPSNKTLGKARSKNNCLLLKQFIVSALQNVTRIKQSRTLLPGKGAAPVPPCLFGHDPKPAVTPAVPSPVPRAPGTHGRAAAPAGASARGTVRFQTKCCTWKGSSCSEGRRSSCVLQQGRNRTRPPWWVLKHSCV